MILRAQRSRYRHHYFYIYDEVLGAMLLRVGSFVPFAVTVYLNGHEFIARRLQKQTIAYSQPENCFTAVGDRDALQEAADAFSAPLIQQRIDYWSFHLGPKFSPKERAACGGLRRFWSLQQIEYCHNFIFKRHHPIRSLFERACELSLYLLSADRIGQLFAQPVRRRVRGKLQSVLERLAGGMHVYRAYWKHSFLKAYEKCRTFLRLEIVCNNLEDFGLKKQLCHLSAVKDKFGQILDRFAHTKAEHLNVHGHLDLLAQIARPVFKGKGKVAGLKLENTRLMRLLEVLLRRAGGGFGGWRTDQLRASILDGFGLQPHEYSRNQIRYDLRKLAAHGIIERIERSYSYALSARGQK